MFAIGNVALGSGGRKLDGMAGRLTWWEALLLALILRSDTVDSM